jgi:hypothetical protein
MFGCGAPGVSSRFRASSMVAMFSGKSRTVSVLNSAFGCDARCLEAAGESGKHIGQAVRIAILNFEYFIF